MLSFASAWLSSTSRDDTHQWIGLLAAALIAFRLMWGFIGSPYARFAQFIRNPKSTLNYLIAILRGTEARYIGHNPAGAMMVLTLLASVAATATTGWLMTTDAYFGDDVMQEFHSFCANATVVQIAVHICGVILASYRHKENLVAAMINGKKRSAVDTDIG